MHVPSNVPSIIPAAHRWIATASLSAALLFGLLPDIGVAGTVNINFTRNSATGAPFPDGTGILGGGGWNRRNKDEATVADILLTSTGASSGVSVVNNIAGAFGATRVNGNPVQNESWSKSVANPIVLTISGLVPNAFYRLACYSDRVGDGVNPTNTFLANGSISGSTNNAGAASVTLPGTAGTDYVILIAPASSLGQIALSTPVIAGLQIQGVLTGELGPKMDCMVTNLRIVPGGKGRGVFGIRPNPAQTFTLNGNRGTTRTFYVNAKNTGVEYDKAFLMAFPDRGLRLKVLDKTTLRNVTANARALRHRFDLNAGQTQGFIVQVGASNPTFSNPLGAGIGCSPSTLKASKQDVVRCVVTP